MRLKLFRIAVLIASVTGLLALFESPASAFVPQQHCEPLVRR